MLRRKDQPSISLNDSPQPPSTASFGAGPTSSSSGTATGQRGILVPAQLHLTKHSPEARQWAQQFGRFEYERDVKVKGWSMYAVDKWITDTTKPLKCILVPNNTQSDATVTLHLLVPLTSLSEVEATREIERVVRSLRRGRGASLVEDHVQHPSMASRQSSSSIMTTASGAGYRGVETEFGVMVVTSLPSLPASCQPLLLRSGDYRTEFSLVKLIINLSRLGCLARSSLVLEPPSEATLHTFYSNYKFSSTAFRRRNSSSTNSVELLTRTVGELVSVVQAALEIWGYRGSNASDDGLLCDDTIRRVIEWRRMMRDLTCSSGGFPSSPPRADTALPQLGHETEFLSEVLLNEGPAIVAALLSSVTSTRYKLSTLDLERVPRDPFTKRRDFIASINMFQRAFLLRTSPVATSLTPPLYMAISEHYTKTMIEQTRNPKLTRMLKHQVSAASAGIASGIVSNLETFGLVGRAGLNGGRDGGGDGGSDGRTESSDSDTYAAGGMFDSSPELHPISLGGGGGHLPSASLPGNSNGLGLSASTSHPGLSTGNTNSGVNGNASTNTDSRTRNPTTAPDNLTINLGAFVRIVLSSRSGVGSGRLRALWTGNVSAKQPIAINSHIVSDNKEKRTGDGFYDYALNSSGPLTRPSITSREPSALGPVPDSDVDTSMETGSKSLGSMPTPSTVSMASTVTPQQTPQHQRNRSLASRTGGGWKSMMVSKTGHAIKDWAKGTLFSDSADEREGGQHPPAVILSDAQEEDHRVPSTSTTGGVSRSASQRSAATTATAKSPRYYHQRTFSSASDLNAPLGHSPRIPNSIAESGGSRSGGLTGRESDTTADGGGGVVTDWGNVGDVDEDPSGRYGRRHRRGDSLHPHRLDSSEPTESSKTNHAGNKQHTRSSLLSPTSRIPLSRIVSTSATMTAIENGLEWVHEGHQERYRERMAGARRYHRGITRRWSEGSLVKPGEIVLVDPAHMKETVELCVLAMALRQRERQLFDKAQAYAGLETFVQACASRYVRELRSRREQITLLSQQAASLVNEPDRHLALPASALTPSHPTPSHSQHESPIPTPPQTAPPSFPRVDSNSLKSQSRLAASRRLTKQLELKSEKLSYSSKELDKNVAAAQKAKEVLDSFYAQYMKAKEEENENGQAKEKKQEGQSGGWKAWFEGFWRS